MVRTNTKEKDLEKTTLFISYSWANANSAKLVEKELEEMEWLKVFKDTKDIKYNDSIKKFMDHISKCDYVICLIGDSYLKSKNCMYEVMQLMKDPFYQKRVRFIAVKQEIEGDEIFDIYGDVSNRKKYIEYWEDKIEKLIVKSKSKKLIKEEVRDLKLYKNIRRNIEEFFDFLKDRKSLSLKELQEENFQSLIKTIEKQGHIKVHKLKKCLYYAVMVALFFMNLFSCIFTSHNKFSIFCYISFLLSFFILFWNHLEWLKTKIKSKKIKQNIVFEILFNIGNILWLVDIILLYFFNNKELGYCIIICTICVFCVSAIAYILKMETRPLLHKSLAPENNLFRLFKYYTFSCFLTGVNLIMIMMSNLPAGEMFLFIHITSSFKTSYMSVYISFQVGILGSFLLSSVVRCILYKYRSLKEIDPLFFVPWQIITLIGMLSLC